GIVGEHLDKTVEIVVVEREQIARHQVLDLGAVTRVTVVIVLRCHDYWTLLKGGLSRACRCDRLRQLLCFAAHYSPPRKPGKPTLRQDPVSNGAARGDQAMAIAPTGPGIAAAAATQETDGPPVAQQWPSERAGAWALCAVIFATFITFLDQPAFGLLAEKMKVSFGISDFVLGLLLGPVTVVAYVIVGIPLARL